MIRRKRALDGLDQDIHNHIARETQDNIERGMAPQEARRQARLKFGNVALAKEDTRRVWVSAWLDQLRQDLRYAARTLRKSRGFYSDSRGHTGAGDWRQHRNVQRPECGSAPAASVSVAGTVGDVVDRGSDAEPSRRQIGTLGCRTVAESKSELRGHGHLRCRVQDADGSRRGGTDRRRQHLSQPALTPRRPSRRRDVAFRPKKPSSGNGWS